MNGKPESAATAPAPGFTGEFAQCWRQLPNKALFFPLLAAWLALFQFLGNCTFGYVDTPSLFRWMWGAYEKGDRSDEHGPFVAAAVLVLFWWKRKELLAVQLRVWLPGLLVLAAALVLHLAGYLVQQQRVSIVALFLGIYGLMGLAWGPAWLRAGFFPFFLLVFCIPIVSISEPVTFPLRMLVSKIVVVLSHVMGINVLRDGTSLFNPQRTYQYEVAAACSGLRSLVAILCLATVYGFLTFDKNWKRLLMIAAAVPLAVVSNVMRMMCIIVAAELSGQATGDFVHENWFFSLVPYVPAMAGVMLLAHWLRERSPAGHPTLEARPA